VRRTIYLSLALLSIGLAACGDAATGPDPSAEHVVELASAVPGTHAVGSEVPVTVRVTANGAGVPGLTVLWQSSGGDGAVSPGAGVTDGEGRAHASWSMGSQSGPRVLVVEAAGADPLVLEAEALAGEAVGVRFPSDTLRLTARRERKHAGGFEDAHGNPAQPPAGAAWTVDDPAVASIDAAGRLRAEGRGVTRVRVDSPLGSDSAAVLVEFRGIITITFDDGFLSTYTRAFPVLEGLGLRGNVAVVTRAVDEEWGDFVTLEHLQELHEAGWAMVSHTLTHDSLTAMSDAELEIQLADSRAWVEERGFRGAGVFVVPFHHWNEREREAVARHYEMARGTSSVEFFPDTLAQWLPDEPYGLTALEAEFAPMSTEAGRAFIREMMERAVEEGLFFELFFHDVTEEMLPGFLLTMEMVAEFAENVVPYDQVLETFVRSAPVAAPWEGRPAPVALGEGAIIDSSRSDPDRAPIPSAADPGAPADVP
jgi:peptidoglycan/xylan/chitin deacetylase (PgdA/CDA1 family)